MSCSHSRCGDIGILAFLCFCGWNVADGFEQSAVIEPVDPFERGVLDSFKRRSPGAAPMDDLGLIEVVDGLGQSVVIAVADAADRWFDPGFGEPFGVADREILAAAIGVMDEAAAARRPTCVERLLQRIQDEACMRLRDARQPSMRRANVSMTNAT